MAADALSGAADSHADAPLGDLTPLTPLGLKPLSNDDRKAGVNAASALTVSKTVSQKLVEERKKVGSPSPEGNLPGKNGRRAVPVTRSRQRGSSRSRRRRSPPRRRQDSPPRKPPRRQWSPPRRQSSPPRRQSSPPRRQSPPPRRQRSPPRKQRSLSCHRKAPNSPGDQQSQSPSEGQESQSSSHQKSVSPGKRDAAPHKRRRAPSAKQKSSTAMRRDAPPPRRREALAANKALQRALPARRQGEARMDKQGYSRSKRQEPSPVADDEDVSQSQSPEPSSPQRGDAGSPRHKRRRRVKLIKRHEAPAPTSGILLVPRRSRK